MYSVTRSESPERGSAGKSFIKMVNNWKCAGLVATAVVLVGVAVTISAIKLSESESGSDNGESSLRTPIGIFKGERQSSPINGRQYTAYKGIPFAKPPLGNLRFARPVPVEPTVAGQYVNAQTNRLSCWSVTKTPTSKYYGEDCLYINIYTPTGIGGSGTNHKFPVLVWLHGGGFVAGSAYPEPIQLVTRGQAIVVMVNYRLGTFGFLTSLDNELPSNNGLWDQYLAIKWVYENIKHFNGDDTTITLMGESAGAVSVGLHSISPITTPYFRKAILQSGAPTSLLARDARQRTKDFAGLVGCGAVTENPRSLAQCLRGASLKDILENDTPDVFSISQAQQQLDFIWMPVVDGEMIMDEPLRLLSNFTYLKSIGVYKKDFMIGILNDDGTLVPENFLNLIPLSDISKQKFYNDLVSFLIRLRYGPDSGNVKTKVLPAINEFYAGEKVTSRDVHYSSVLDLVSDVVFFIPSTELALSVSECFQSLDSCAAGSTKNNVGRCAGLVNASKTFFYHFDYCPPKDSCQAPCMGHGESFQYEFPKTNFSDPVLQKMSDQFIDFLVAFAKDSNPGQVFSSGWPEFNSLTQNYLRFGPYPSVRRFLYNSRATFWRERIRDLL